MFSLSQVHHVLDLDNKEQLDTIEHIVRLLNIPPEERLDSDAEFILRHVGGNKFFDGQKDRGMATMLCTSAFHEVRKIEPSL